MLQSQIVEASSTRSPTKFAHRAGIEPTLNWLTASRATITPTVKIKITGYLLATYVAGACTPARIRTVFNNTIIFLIP